MEMFLKGTSFHGVMLDYLFTSPSEMKKKLYDLVEEGIMSGAVQPLVRTVFAADEVEQAFRYIYQVMKCLQQIAKSPSPLCIESSFRFRLHTGTTIC
jgi:hypothetical protein